MTSRGTSATDPVGQIISLAGPKGLIWKQLEAAGDWGVRFPANDGVVFTYILAGQCRFSAYGQSRALGSGDFVLLVRPPEWILSSRDDVIPIDYSARHPATARLRKGEGPQTRTVGGRFVFDESSADLLKELLPSLVLVRAGDEGAGRVRPILDLLGDEAKADRPGQSFVLERLMELLLVEVVRNPQALAPSSPQPALLRALADPHIARALRAMHADVARRWTVEALAARAGMSRSSFAARFASVVGLPPIDYLLDWRMALAKCHLRGDNGTLSQIAELVGYSSVSAFSAAFTKRVGCPPSIFAAQGVGGDGERLRGPGPTASSAVM